MSDIEAAEAELTAARPRTLFAAGNDYMVKTYDGLWYRASDNSLHTSVDLADFHGHSGYSLMDQSQDVQS